MKNCKDFYNDTAQMWADNWYGNESLLPYLKKFLNFINKDNPKILDLGCGAGYESMRLKNLGAKVVGIDFSEKELEIAREKNPNIDFFERNILMSYKDLGKFDGIVCIGVIIHFKDDELKQVFKNMAEVLNKNGYLLLVFREGTEYKHTSNYNNIEYDRNFIYHMRENILTAMNNEFEYICELPANDTWKYLIYKKK